MRVAAHIHMALSLLVVPWASCCVKLSLGSCRARQRQNLQNLQTKQSNYAETVENLEQVNLDNRELEVEKQRLEAELSQLNGVQHIRPSAPASSNGYSDSDSNNSSTGPAVFTTRVGRDIVVEPAHAVKYRKTEQLWFAKVTPAHVGGFSASAHSADSHNSREAFWCTNINS